MFNLVKCSACGTSFNNAVSPNCSKCKTEYSQSQSNKSKKTLLNKLEPAITETNPLVIAQNRTTHAVRALAIMLVAAPLISLIVGIALVFSLSNENNLALGFAVSLLGLFALIRVIVAALVELNKSKIPE